MLDIGIEISLIGDKAAKCTLWENICQYPADDSYAGHGTDLVENNQGHTFLKELERCGRKIAALQETQSGGSRTERCTRLLQMWYCHVSLLYFAQL